MFVVWIFSVLLRVSSVQLCDSSCYIITLSSTENQVPNNLFVRIPIPTEATSLITSTFLFTGMTTSLGSISHRAAFGGA